ncbi:CoA-disulfide reductase [Glaciihabitans sp. INWT7]|uniref:FAD-dependent oxidoreductase n=1 Tax=Glaciihabitans sp. INWT7 TaxID=2596912 RepID=UPI0016243734|nr:FAD-dependent oxidoreductase [Glaciihabitans sp. INWT7]QNE45637.1 CoA-disulfide reductase [Glaciihabitans sp. INWT7]
MKTVVVGGVAGGMSAATRLRRLDESMEIVVFERGRYVSFANCGLPYYVGGVIGDRDSLLLQTPQSLASRFALDVRVEHEVTSIDPDRKVVHVTDLRNGTSHEQSYDFVVLAGGATASAVDGASAVPSFTLRSVDDVDHITATLATVTGQAHAVVIGGGFIGLEAVENLIGRGVAVTLIQRGAHVLSPLDREMAAPVLTVLRQHGVDVRTDTTVVSASDGFVLLDDGSRVRADLVIEASGVRPELSVARSAGLTIGPTGGIAVDRRQRTSDPSIFAVGDGVEKIDAVDASPTLVTMAGLANRHGRAAADAIAGHAEPAWPALGTSIVGVFELTIAMVGWSEKRLTSAGRAHRVIHTHPASHATYYPGAETMALKLLVDPQDDSILGAQIVGGSGVDKRIDVIATAMAGGLTASALAHLELAYAPQYGSAKDAVNMAGYVADNLATGMTRSVQWHELDALRGSGTVLVDVRTASEFAAGSIPGAVNIPLDELRLRHVELADRPLIVHCQVGQRGHTATRLLTQLGHDVRNLDGGYKTWVAGVSTVDREPTPTLA